METDAHSIAIRSVAAAGYSDESQIRLAVAAAFSDATIDGRPMLQAAIRPDSKVTLLPNHVTNLRSDESQSNFWAKITHPIVLSAAIDEVLSCLGEHGRLQIGNSPLQSADYARLRAEVGIDGIETALLARGESRATFHDLRTVKSKWRGSQLLEVTEDSSEETVEVDLGSDSYLDELFQSGVNPRVRVGDYDPSATERYHGNGRHIYVINKRVLDADVVLSVPKMKTHQKVGITCALKGCVGTVGRKECLAHHRQGGQGTGGDEFFGDAKVRRVASRFLDVVSVPRTGPVANGLRFAAKVLYRLSSMPEHGHMGGAWFGNDTAWRMTLDLARIVRYADARGVMHDTPQRSHFTLIDGIVGGDGNGPLRPNAVDSRILIAGADVVQADIAAARVMGLNPAMMPMLVRGTDAGVRYPTSTGSFKSFPVTVDGARIDAQAIQKVHHFEPSKGWKPVFETQQAARQ
jgi:uncharacterized protein (DUF362 family)